MRDTGIHAGVIMEFYGHKETSEVTLQIRKWRPRVGD